jgi:dolichyl-phosphate-mannose--protein O-mannosyl transferase
MKNGMSYWRATDGSLAQVYLLGNLFSWYFALSMIGLFVSGYGFWILLNKRQIKIPILGNIYLSIIMD